MILFVVTLLIILLAGWWYYRDRQYLKKQTEEVISDDMKKILNIPTKGDQFPKDVQKYRGQKSRGKKRISHEIITLLNEEDDAE